MGLRSLRLTHQKTRLFPAQISGRSSHCRKVFHKAEISTLHGKEIDHFRRKMRKSVTGKITLRSLNCKQKKKGGRIQSAIDMMNERAFTYHQCDVHIYYYLYLYYLYYYFNRLVCVCVCVCVYKRL